jgi:hypothetical protein
MRLRLTPRDDSYYLAFAAAGRTIATAADLLCDLVSGTEGRKHWLSGSVTSNTRTTI